MRRDFIAVAVLTESVVCAAGFPAAFAGRCRSAVPFMRFLTEAVGQPF